MSRGKDRVPTDGSGSSLSQNPFGALSGAGLPAAHANSSRATPNPANATNQPAAPLAVDAPKKNRGRVEIRRETAGRGGKTVTTASGFLGIGLPEKEELAKKMQRAGGTGGTVKDGRIEIQGDKRDVVARILEEAGFRPVMAGG